MADKNSFKSMVFDMQNSLMSFAMKLTLNRDDANDLVQDTTLKAFNNEDKFVDSSNPKGWMFTIMRNIFINNYHKAVRENTIIDTTDDFHHLNLCSDSGFDSPDGAFSVKEINDVIATLAPEIREPFNMHIAGYKYEEIADRMNVPVGTIKCRIFTARKKLKEILSDYR